MGKKAPPYQLQRAGRKVKACAYGSAYQSPRSWQPEVMQQLGLITPHAWALIAYDQLLNRELPDLNVVWNCCGVMVAFTAGFFAVGWWRFRHLD